MILDRDHPDVLAYREWQHVEPRTLELSGWTTAEILRAVTFGAASKSAVVLVIRGPMHREFGYLTI